MVCVTNLQCPFFNDNCRFCSHEHLIVPYARLIENTKTKRLEPGATEHMPVPLGAFCNNVGVWVSDLKYCPARWALANSHHGVLADGTGCYPDSQIVMAPSILFRNL